MRIFFCKQRKRQRLLRHNQIAVVSYACSIIFLVPQVYYKPCHVRQRVRIQKRLKIPISYLIMEQEKGRKVIVLFTKYRAKPTVRWKLLINSHTHRDFQSYLKTFLALVFFPFDPSKLLQKGMRGDSLNSAIQLFLLLFLLLLSLFFLFI